MAMGSNGPPNTSRMPPKGQSEDQQMERFAGEMPGHAMQRVQAGAITAVRVQVPRDLKSVKTKVTFEAQQMAEDFCYAWPQKDKYSALGFGIIEGVSIEGAMVLARNWTNCTSDIELAVDEVKHWIFKATFIDYEAGFALPRLFRQRKSESHGGYDNERQQDIAFQIGQSKAQRNAVDKAMPSWLKTAAIKAAKDAAAEKYQDRKRAFETAKDACIKAQISSAQIVAFFGKKLIDLSPIEYATLFMILAAKKVGIDVPDLADDPEAKTAIPPTPNAPTPEPAAATPAPAADDGFGDEGTPTPAASTTPPDVKGPVVRTGDAKADATWVPKIIAATSHDRLDEIKGEMLEFFGPDHAVWKIFNEKVVALGAELEAKKIAAEKKKG